MSRKPCRLAFKSEFVPVHVMKAYDEVAVQLHSEA